MKTYRGFFELLKASWILVALGLGLNLLFGFLKTIGAVYLQKITDALEAGAMEQILSLVLIGGSLTFLSFAVRWLGAILPQFLQEKFSYQIRLRLLEQLGRIPFLRFESYSAGELQSRIQNDSKKAGQALYTILSRIANNVFLFLFSIWFMATTNVLATVIAVVTVVAATWVNQTILKRMKKYDKAAQQNLAEMTRSLEHTFSAMETVKTAGAEEYAVGLYQKRQNEYCENRMRSTRVGALRTLWYSITENLCLYGSILYLGILGIRGVLTIGEVLMFIYLVKQIIMPIEVIFRWMSNLPGSAASWERIHEILEQEQDAPYRENEELISAQTLELTQIDFAYNKDRPILKDVGLCLTRGHIIGLSGESGSGKTTLLKLLMGLYHSPAMQVIVDDRASLPPIPWDIAYASLENCIFPMSIYDNIVLGNENVRKDQVREILKELGFSDWIDSLPMEIDTVAEGMSGGQKQAVVNARTLLSGRNIMIFDEPFSALDTDKEACLVKILKLHKKNAFILLTSHRIQNSSLLDGWVKI